MNKFTNFSSIIAVNEAKRLISNDIMTVKELEEYMDKTSKKIPKPVHDVLYLTKKYELLDQQSIDSIRDASKSQLDKIAFKYDIPATEIESLWKALKELKTNLRLLPQYQTLSERESFMAGKLQMSDITIDLETSAGRNAVAKLYAGMVHKIVNQYVGTSNLNKADLFSAAQLGFTDAMNDWRKGDDGKNVPFKTYASYRVKQQILHDIDKYSYSLSGTNWYAREKMGSTMLTAISIDGMGRNDDGEINPDRLAALGMDDPELSVDEIRSWEKLYKIIDSLFKQRDADIFYKYFGLKGYQKEKGKDIARSMGMSAGNIKPIIDKILKQLTKNPDAYEILQDLNSAYNESLFSEIMPLDNNMVVEYLLNDDMFMLLEELTKWINKDHFKAQIVPILKELGSSANIIKDLLSGDFENLDSNFKSNKKLITKFLSAVYPTENISRKTDVSLLEYMDELSYFYKKHML
jgi:RNA polymerase sigma factor (sigma-70 family)